MMSPYAILWEKLVSKQANIIIIIYINEMKDPKREVRYMKQHIWNELKCAR